MLPVRLSKLKKPPRARRPPLGAPPSVALEAVQLLMEEYRTLRDEILASISAQQAALTFGGAAIAILAATGTSLRKDDIGSSIPIFLVLIPFVCYFALNTWLAEVIRMLRAGSWLRRIERRVNRHVSLEGHDCPLLFWENWAHTADQENVEQMHLLSIAGGYLLIAFASTALGCADLFRRTWDKGSRFDVTNWLLVMLAFGALVLLVFVCWRSWRVYGQADTLRMGQPDVDAREPCP
ncbi:MAG: hypothetical protein LC789_00175 [Actinobacteria bacterium]|nr:hypothetical protein [Actinomycetota bacterium]MCA1719851.1 hypothetical protein [Actinomycetota bacterium]